MKKTLMLVIGLLVLSVGQAQTNWSDVDFVKKYKMKAKIPGSIKKTMKSSPTFVNDYYLGQVSLQKGSSKPGVLQKQGVKAVFAEAALAGVSEKGLQNLIDELYANFVKQLEGAGLNITNGDEVIESAKASGKDKKKSAWVGKADGKVIFDKGGINNSDIKEINYFRPMDKNIYMTKSIIGGNFYLKEAKKSGRNMIGIGYTVRFANFKSSKTTRKNMLETKGGLMIIPTITLYGAKGIYGSIAFDKPILGDNEWSEGLVQTDSRDGSFWGLSSSADYSIKANEAKYLAELKDIVTNLQKDLAGYIKNQIN